jgi:protocatechuate 3,4-dioxygenase beta subunit
MTSRREFLSRTSLGLAVASGTGELLLRADAAPTLANGVEAPASGLVATRPVVAGPFYRAGAPYRAKSTAPFEQGTVLLLSGRIWSLAARRPIAGAVMDVWHVDVEGNYSNGATDFRNRARLITAEDGSYELEAIHPVPYTAGAGWRCPHVHFSVAAPGHKALVSEMYFKGDPRQDTDFLFHPSLCVPLERRSARGQDYEAAVFDVVMERAG